MNEKRTAQRRLFHGHGLIALFICIAAAGSILSGTLLALFRPEASTKVSERTLTFAERVAYQRAIEDVYWRHRIWPKGERPDPKPSLDAVISQAQLEKKVADYLRKSQRWKITGNSQLPLSNCRPKWIAWRSTPNSPMYCANFLKRSVTILLSSLSAWRDRSR